MLHLLFVCFFQRILPYRFIRQYVQWTGSKVGPQVLIPQVLIPQVLRPQVLRPQVLRPQDGTTCS